MVFQTSDSAVTENNLFPESSTWYCANIYCISNCDVVSSSLSDSPLALSCTMTFCDTITMAFVVPLLSPAGRCFQICFIYHQVSVQCHYACCDFVSLWHCLCSGFQMVPLWGGLFLCSGFDVVPILFHLMLLTASLQLQLRRAALWVVRFW